MLVVLDQVPHLDAALQVGGDHGRARAEAVGAARVADHVFCRDTQTHPGCQTHSQGSPSAPAHLSALGFFRDHVGDEPPNTFFQSIVRVAGSAKVNY